MLERLILRLNLKSRIMKEIRSCFVPGILLLSVAGSAQPLNTEPQQSPTEWVGHRGASYDAPENTVESARLAWERGADGVEVDVYLTADDQVVVIHDKTTKRTTPVDLKVADSTLADLLRLDAGSWKDPKWEGSRIPSLSQVLDAAPQDSESYLVIEIKCGPEIIPALQRAIAEACFPYDRIRFISFNWDVIHQIKPVFPDISALWLSGFKKNQEGVLEPSVDTLIAKAQLAGADGLDVSHTGVVDAEFVEKVHDAGLLLWVYTVNDPIRAQTLVDFHVDSITTDRPQWIRQQLNVERQ